MIVRTLSIPTDWQYLFESIVAKQIEEDWDNPTTFPIKIYSFIYQEHLPVYKGLSLIDPEMELLKINRLGIEEEVLVMNLVPFSERFFVPEIFNHPFIIVQRDYEILKALQKEPTKDDIYRTSLELLKTSKPIT